MAARYRVDRSRPAAIRNPSRKQPFGGLASKRPAPLPIWLVLTGLWSWYVKPIAGAGVAGGRDGGCVGSCAAGWR